MTGPFSRRIVARARSGRLRRILPAAAILCAAPASWRGPSAPAVPGGPGAAEPATRPAAGLAGWSALTLESDPPGPLLSATVRLELSGAVHEASGRPAIVLRTSSDVRLMGAVGLRERTASCLDLETGRPFELLRVRPGESARRVQFLEGRVRVTNWEPAPGGQDGGEAAWSETGTSERPLRFPDGGAPAASERITDAYALVYLLRKMDLASGGAASDAFAVLHRRRLARVRLEAGERRSRSIDLLDESGGAQVTLAVRERLMTVRPADPDASDSLLGMQGPATIWVEEAGGAPLEIAGRLPAAGPVRLVAISFRRGAGSAHDQPGSASSARIFRSVCS